MELMQGLCHEDSQLQLRCCRLPTLRFAAPMALEAAASLTCRDDPAAVSVRGSFFESKMPLAGHSRARHAVCAGAPAMHWSQRSPRRVR